MHALIVEAFQKLNRVLDNNIDNNNKIFHTQNDS